MHPLKKYCCPRSQKRRLIYSMENAKESFYEKIYFIIFFKVNLLDCSQMNCFILIMQIQAFAISFLKL